MPARKWRLFKLRDDCLSQWESVEGKSGPLSEIWRKVVQGGDGQPSGYGGETAVTDIIAWLRR
ncbi:hypothetical protein AVEN_119510-1, partial [Araneus ventricosus]